MIGHRTLVWLESMGGKWAKETSEKWGMGLAQRKPQFTDVTLRLEHLDRNGIALQVITPQHALDSNLLPGDLKAQLEYARIINDGMAELMEKSKGRLLAAASIPLSKFEEGGRQEMERAINTLGLKVVNLPSNMEGKPVDLPEYEPFWTMAAEMNIPVYIHPNDPVATTGRSYEADYDLIHNFGWPYETTLTLARLVFSGIMERYPTLNVVSHHLGGGMIPFYWGRTLETYEPENQKKIYGGQVGALPKSLFDYFSRFYYDTAVGGSTAAIKCAYEVFGVDRLIFASDAPFGPGSGEFRLSEYPKSIELLDIPEADKKKIFYQNAQRLLGLD